MNVTRVQHVLNSLMILSFLIFGALAGIILLVDPPIIATTVSLPFAFLFIAMMTLIITGQIEEKPHLIKKYLLEWLVISIFGITISALAFTLA